MAPSLAVVAAARYLWELDETTLERAERTERAYEAEWQRRRAVDAATPAPRTFGRPGVPFYLGCALVFVAIEVAAFGVVDSLELGRRSPVPVRTRGRLHANVLSAAAVAWHAWHNRLSAAAERTARRRHALLPWWLGVAAAACMSVAWFGGDLDDRLVEQWRARAQANALLAVIACDTSLTAWRLARHHKASTR